MEYKELNKQLWGKHLWARGYFVASSGNAEHNKNQDIAENMKPDNFNITEFYFLYDFIPPLNLACFHRFHYNISDIILSLTTLGC